MITKASTPKMTDDGTTADVASRRPDADVSWLETQNVDSAASSSENDTTTAAAEDEATPTCNQCNRNCARFVVARWHTNASANSAAQTAISAVKPTAALATESASGVLAG